MYGAKRVHMRLTKKQPVAVSEYLPALWVGGVEGMDVTESDGGTASAETQQFTLGAFLKAFVLAVGVHLRAVKDIAHILVHGADITVEPPARHQSPLGGNSEMAVATVAAVINSVLVQAIRDFPQALLIEIERPKVVFEVEGRAAIFMLFKLLPTSVKEFAVLLWLDMPCFFMGFIFACRTIATEGEDVGVVFNDDVDEVRQFVNVRCTDGTHYGTAHSSIANGLDSSKCSIERAVFAEAVVCVAQAVKRELVFLTTEGVHALADFGCEVERIAHQREGYAVRVDEFKQIPKARVQNRVATCDIEIWGAVHLVSHALNVGKGANEPLPRCFNECGVSFGKDIAVLAPLVAIVGYVPLKGEVFFHNQYLIIASAGQFS